MLCGLSLPIRRLQFVGQAGFRQQPIEVDASTLAGLLKHGREICSSLVDRPVVMADRLQSAVDDRLGQSSGKMEKADL